MPWSVLTLWRCKILWRIIACFLLGLQFASAHEGRPLYLQLNELDQQQVQLVWRLPPKLNSGNRPIVDLKVHHGSDQTETCQSNSNRKPLGPQVTGQTSYFCPTGEAPLDQSPKTYSLTLSYPATNPGVTALIRTTSSDGITEARFIQPNQININLSFNPKENENSSLWNYFKQGVIHIAGGYDHLLFVACLLLIAVSWRRVLLTISGFTLAHSITLALSVFEVVRVPIAAVETVIALSIAFLAAELLNKHRDSLTWRKPIIVAIAFGLLHGFGFASALSEIGLPDNEKISALLLFNLGVEAGQICFVLVLTPVIYLFRKYQINIHKPAAYAIGVLAMFWTLQRLLG